jgi:hypothetical protein
VQFCNGPEKDYQKEPTIFCPYLLPSKSDNQPGYHRGKMFVPHLIFPKQLGEPCGAGAGAHEFGVEIDYSVPRPLVHVLVALPAQHSTKKSSRVQPQSPNRY